MKYQCPVCGYDQLNRPPADMLICACCGTEFGNDDIDFTHSELRFHWVKSEMPWFSDYTLPPVNWDPAKQLRALIGHSEIGGVTTLAHEYCENRFDLYAREIKYSIEAYA